MPLEFSISPLDTQNPTVKLLEGASTEAMPGVSIAPYHSNKLIQTDQPFKIVFGWDQVENSIMLQGGTWHFDIYLEQMGPGEATSAAGHFTGTQAANPNDGLQSFTKHVGANVVAPGLYRLTVCQQYYHGTTPLALVMFGDVGLVRFYKEQ